jgi:MFS-type transporter involved in bile tolerance (Atg22 family)
MNYYMASGVLVSGAWILLAYIVGRDIDRNDSYHFWTGMCFWCFIPALYLLWVLARLTERFVA